MSRRTRFMLYFAIAFAVCLMLVAAMAFGVGQNPFDPNTRHIWAVSLIAAIYASFRTAMIVERIMRWRAKGKDARPQPRGFSILGKREHDIDRRMAARRERIEAAKAKSDESIG
jgi:DNA invertase Pin-like site-specific DNA recombinase